MNKNDWNNMHNDPNTQGNVLTALLGAPTRAKASGVAFSLSAILPQVLSIIFIIFTAGLVVEGQEPDWYLYCNYLLPEISFLVVAYFFVQYTKPSIKEVWQQQKCPVKYYVIALLLQLGLLSLSSLNTWFLQLLGEFGYTDSGIFLPSMQGFGFIGVLIVIAVLPALLEEILFRGILLQGLRSFGQMGSILLCGALFALYHQNPAQTLYQFCCGVAFALVALRAGSVLPTMLAHFVNNALILTLTKLGIEEIPVPLQITFLIISALALIGTVSYLVFMDTRNSEKQQDEKSERKRFWKGAAAGIAMCALTWLLVFAAGL